MRFRSAAALLLALFTWSAFDAHCGETASSGQKKVYVLPIRDDIMPPWV